MTTPTAGRPFGHRLARLTHLPEGRAIAIPLLMVVGLLAVWEAAVRALDVPGYALPSPSAIWIAAAARPDILWSNTLVTVKEAVFGFVAATAIAIPLAFVVVQWPVARQGIYPILILLNSVPKIALAPIVVIWFGFGDLPKTIVALLSCFFPVFLDSAAGFASTPSDDLALMKSLRSSPIQTFLKLRGPHALPQVFVGLKVGSTFAVIGAVTAEFVSSSEGLGYLILVYSIQLQTAFSFAAIIMLAIVSVTMFNIVEAIERIAIPWSESHQAARR